MGLGADSHTKQNPDLNPFIDMLSQPALLIDLDGKIETCNEAFAGLYSISQAQLLEKNIFKLFEEWQITPPFSSVENALLERKSQTTIRLEQENLELSKTIRWTVSEIKNQIKIKSILFIGTEISDIVLASNREHFLKSSIIDHIPNHYIFWKDINSVYLGCNRALAAVMGLDSERDIIGKTDFDLPTSREQSEAYRTDDQLVMKTGQPKLNIEESQTLSDGVERVLSTNKTPLFDEDGKVYGILAIYSDITDRKNLERSLEAAKDQAEAANNAKTEFIANMSHDIRTPLNGIIGLSELLEDMLEGREHKEYARWINESGKELLSLLNDILDIIRADKINEHDLNKEDFNLRQCLQSIILLETPSTKHRNIEIEMHVDEAIPKLVRCDRTKLHRILLNLLGNSIKFTEKGKISIEAYLMEKKEEDLTIKFQVVDTGIGIPKEVQSQVFERFFRANPSYENQYSGHGVGLHIAQAYVKLLGGEIKLQSEPQIGTKFYFEITVQQGQKKPRLVQQSDRPKFSNQSVNPVSNNTREIEPKKINNAQILLVEDNFVSLKMAQTFIHRSQYEVVAVMSAEEALSVLRHRTFDLIITDIGLPGLSGYEFAKLVRHMEQENAISATPIIGLTAHDQEQSIEKCLHSGMNEVFCKPVNFEVMKKILKQFIKSEACQPKCLSNLSQKDGLGPDLPNSEAELFNLSKYSLFDAEEALTYIGCSDTLNDMLELMVSKELDYDCVTLHNAHLKQDWEDIAKIAHRMKGGAAYCGAIRLRYACQYLERYHKAGHNNLLESLYTQLLSTVACTRQALQKVLLAVTF